jgi:pimeloyl-ACP methyl ester carboxylesterase
MLGIILILALFILLFTVGGVCLFGHKRMTQAKKQSPEKCFATGKRRNLYTKEDLQQHPHEEVFLTSADGLQLHGIYVEPFPEAKRVMVIVHGYTVAHPWSLQFMKLFIPQQYNVLLIDQRAHGLSEGKYTTYGYKEKEDLACWVSWLIERKGSDCLIGFHGQSLGGATVLEYSQIAKHPIPFMIIDCAFSDFSRLIRYQMKKLYKIPLFPFYYLVEKLVSLRAGFHFSDCQPLRAVQNSDFPILFIHGGADWFIPPQMSIEMHEAQKKGWSDLVIVPGASHGNSLPTNPVLYREAVDSFLSKIEVSSTKTMVVK